MGRVSLNEILMDLREGRITLAKFFAVADGDIRRMADAMFTRWVLPPAIAAEDLYQEMRCAVVAERRDLDWKPGTRNKQGQLISISVHFNWHMHVAGKRWLHAQRGAKRRSGHAMSEFPICMAFFRADDSDIDDYDQFATSVEATQPQEQAAREVLLEVYDALPIARAVAWAIYIKEGDEEQAARRIDASAGLGTTCQASCLNEARGVVKRAVKEGRAIARGMNVAA
jgi:hypothetical protein